MPEYQRPARSIALTGYALAIMNLRGTQIVLIIIGLALIGGGLFFALNSGEEDHYEIVATYPHDPKAFTQGLFWHDGTLYEGTGKQGTSYLRRVKLETGEVLQEAKLDQRYFGEGIALLNGQIYQLTYKARVLFVYDAKTFEVKRRFGYAHEGWGLTTDGERLIMSDGSAVLRFLDPKTCKENGRIDVTHDGKPLERLNELEWIKDEIWANVWQEDRIARIDPETGTVNSFVNLGSLRSKGGITGKVDVLNGIAYDAEGDRIFVTGKYWNKLFQIRSLRP